MKVKLSGRWYLIEIVGNSVFINGEQLADGLIFDKDEDQTIPDAIRDGAREMRHWHEAYLRFGFTHDETMALLCKPLVVIPGGGLTPEMSEFISKATAIMNRDLEESS